MNASLTRLGIFISGVLGATGLAAAAGASHSGDTVILGSLALIALTQAPVILAVSLHAESNRLMLSAAVVIAAGAVLFCADLALRHFTGNYLFPMSAPIGGTAMIGGWALLATSAFIRTDTN